MIRPDPGIATELSDGVRCLLAPNPGPMTHWGTNTWLVGTRDVAIIDPGPASTAHLEAILAATSGQKISHILVTHAHADHSALAAPLSRRTGAEVYGYGAATAGRSAFMSSLAEHGDIAGGEGVDTAFAPDTTLKDGDVVRGGDWDLTVHHTPGHFAGHLAFQLGETLFSGDHVMGWATTLVSPPDGDLRAFLETSERLAALDFDLCLPGHGAPLEEPASRLRDLIAHRRAREAAILDHVLNDGATISEITALVYSDIPPEMHAVAARNVLAHLIDLIVRKEIRTDGPLSTSARFYPA